MTRLFTPEDLVQYLYKETSPEKTAVINTAIQEDWTLREKLDVLQSSLELLNRPVESPREEVILRVLDYARSTESESVGHP